MSRLELQGIRKRVGDTDAVAGVDLTVEQGELLVLLGPQGAGITTLLKIVAGEESPDAGTVRVGGNDVTRAKPGRRGIALVNPRATLPEKRTAEQIIQAASRGRGLKRAESASRVTEAVNLARCEAALPHRPDRLTLEGRRRVLLAQALASRPDVLLLDEPLIGLDEGAADRVLIDLKAGHARSARTTVYGASSVPEAFATGGRIAVLRDGVVEQVGTPTELYDEPASRFVAMFVGTPPINLLPVSSKGGRMHAGPFSLAMRGDDEKHLKRPVELGVRPEHIAISPARGGVEANVLGVEMTQAGMYLHVEAGGERLLVRPAAGSTQKAGMTIRIAVRRANTRLFDVETGKAYPNP